MLHQFIHPQTARSNSAQPNAYGVDFAAVRAAGPADVARRLGFDLIGARTLSPCPACHAEHRSSRGRDRRGPVGLTANGLGWRCHRCDVGGDAVRFATWAVTGSARPHDWRDVIAALQSADYAGTRPALAVVPNAARSQPRRPPRRELLDLWARSRPVIEDAEASAWLKGRELDPWLVADRELARAISPDLAPPELPTWARLWGPWTTRGYRLLFALWNAEGQLASLHARNVLPEADPKGAFPSDFSVAGTVMADAAGVLMLTRRELAGPLWIVEGAPDFLSAATAWGDAAEPGAAVLGIISGSWTSELASRVPAGARVVIAVHHDRSGEKYVSRIADTLAGRVQLDRWTPGPRATA